MFSSIKKKKRERFNEELNQAIDDSKSTIRTGYSQTRRSLRPSVQSSMNFYSSKKDSDLISVTTSEIVSMAQSKKCISPNPNQEIEKKSELILQIK